MKKIPSLYVRDFSTKPLTLTGKVTPGCEWVIAGEGVATVKWDGTAMLVRDGKLWKRYDAKHGKTPPAGWEACEDAPDPVTKHWPGWVPVGDGPADRLARETFDALIACDDPTTHSDGTYEFVGTKVNGNPHRLWGHGLWRHGAVFVAETVDRTPDGLRAALDSLGIVAEGFVFHHPDGRMCKVKRTDLGMSWPPDGAVYIGGRRVA